MLTCKWDILSMSSKDIGDCSAVVYNAVFTKLGVDENGLTGVFKSAINFSVDNIDSADVGFTPFDSLTQNDIVNWIKDQFNEEMIDEHILREIDLVKQNNTVWFSGQYPWDN